MLLKVIAWSTILQQLMMVLTHKLNFKLAFSQGNFPLARFLLRFRTASGKIADWDHALHDLQLSFGVKEFVVSLSLSS